MMSEGSKPFEPGFHTDVHVNPEFMSISPPHPADFALELKDVQRESKPPQFSVGLVPVHFRDPHDFSYEASTRNGSILSSDEEPKKDEK